MVVLLVLGAAQLKRPIGFVTHEDKKNKPSKPSSSKAKATGKRT